MVTENNWIYVGVVKCDIISEDQVQRAALDSIGSINRP